MFDALLFLLGRGLVGLEEVEVVGVATEDSLIVHDVEGVTAVVLVAVKTVSIGLAELILPLHDSRLSAVKCLGHFQK